MTEGQALNSYGGGIGELLGVSLFAVGWLGCTMVLAWRSGIAPRWLVIAGGIATVALGLPLVELAGVDPGPLTYRRRWSVPARVGYQPARRASRQRSTGTSRGKSR